MSASLDDVVTALKKLVSLLSGDDKLPGTWAYSTAATVTPPAGAIVIAVSCHSSAGGTCAIFGGSAVAVPAGASFSPPIPYGSLVGDGAKQVVFVGTDAQFVAWVV